MIGAVNLADINGLRTMFSGMGVISKIINIPLTAAEKVARPIEQAKSRRGAEHTRSNNSSERSGK
jgi:hypothetical protein